MSDFDGMPLRYLIGGNDGWPGRTGEVCELSYDARRPALQGLSIKYGNLFDEKNSGNYAPYLEPGDTAGEYNEGQIDPDGAGWTKNIDEQIARAQAQSFDILELDNADSYALDDVLGACDRVQAAGLKTIAKNPLICQGDVMRYVAHPAVVAAIVERDCGEPLEMDELRRLAGKADLPVWFVSFGGGKPWAEAMARNIKANDLRNMGVTWDPSSEEYAASVDVYRPVAPEPKPTESAKVKITIRAPEGVQVQVVQREQQA